ncbi:MAG TPA: hypothetical protein DD706_23090 [Nitrospiraceae bacterium]|nr:hypothetical protein [Nitrospiraceae bacterium]
MAFGFLMFAPLVLGFHSSLIGYEVFQKRDGIILMSFTENPHCANIQISKKESAIVSTKD